MTELVPTREHIELAAAVRNLLDRRSDSQAVRRAMQSPTGFDTDLWRTLCDQIGVAALPIAEERGGAGFSLVETCVVLEELGRALTPSPLLASTVATAGLQAAGGSPLLGDIASGAIATLAWSGITGSVDAPVDVTWRDGVLVGSIPTVLYGASADILLVVAEHAEGIGMFTIDSTSAARTRLGGLDPTLEFARVECDGIAADPVVLDAKAILSATHRVGTLATAALQVGCAQRGLDMTVEYAKQREQFGRPIGSFQALKHRLADMLVKVQMSRAAAWAAVQGHVHGVANADRLAAAAASYCAEAAMAVASETVQMHGGIAITWEHDAHLVFKRAQALDQLFGRPHHHRAVLV